MGINVDESFNKMQQHRESIFRDGIGCWKIDRKGNFYCTHPDSGEYWIAMDRLTDSPKMLDFIAQLANKSWVTSDILGDFVRLTNEVINYQGSLCGSGVGERISIEDIAFLISQARKWAPAEAGGDDGVPH